MLLIQRMCKKPMNNMNHRAISTLFLRATFFFIFIVSCGGKSSSPGQFIEKNEKEVVSFIYHRFNDGRYPTTNTTTKDFEFHLKYLADHGFRIVNYSDAIAYLKSNGPTQKTACITIDDGYTSFYKHGLPLLKKYKMPATLFINTKTVGGGDYMDWSELKNAMSNGIEIGNHSHSHDYFLNKPAAERYTIFKEEIELTQNLINKNLGITPTIFSFPYGEFDQQMMSIVKEAGFIAAAAQNSGVMYDNMDFFLTPRFPMAEAYSSPAKFVEKVNTKALRIQKLTPNSGTLPPDKRPILTLTFDPTGLRMDQLQCFVQGGTCSLRIVDKEKATITVQASTPISKRRRTLYTITVPGKDGKWRWYSHLWINEKEK